MVGYLRVFSALFDFHRSAQQRFLKIHQSSSIYLGIHLNLALMKTGLGRLHVCKSLERAPAEFGL